MSAGGCRWTPARRWGRGRGWKAAMARHGRGTDLVPCSLDPVTGFSRNGCCDTGAEDAGVHAVCVVMTAEFLDFSRCAGNDSSYLGRPATLGKDLWLMSRTNTRKT